MIARSFDVFFSYSTRDHAVVERVARTLTDHGIRIFLDRWYLTPGQPWPQALEQTLAACNAVAVFIGADGLGPWQQRERDLALDRQARDSGFPVIPVLLTRADPALGFLKLNTWVDLSGRAADPEAMAVLSAAIRREPPGPLAHQRSEAVRAAICPYRGLQPFREEDEPFFFGRTTFAETLTATALRQPFVAVIGASGSGKSSVVRAGLIPRLRRGAGNLVWDAITLVPTDRPLVSLSAALMPLLDADLSEVKHLAEVTDLASHLQTGRIELRDVATRVLGKQPGTDRLLLFVDQWEEVYTLCGDASVRHAFIGQLLNAAASEAISVVLTLRGDFMGHALANRELSDQLQDAVVTIGPMTHEELAETITRPAEKVGLGFEPGLVETILDDLGDEPGGLPLLEFLLEGLWAERRWNILHHDAYRQLGRVAGAIAHRAEEVFARRLNDAEREAAPRLLISMVRPGEGMEDTRQRAALPEDDAVAGATIQKLAKERLVVIERDPSTGKANVEVAHEALIRGWQRLRDWVDQDREFLRTRERIAAQARLWQGEGRLPDRLLSPGRPLAEGEDLLVNRRADLEPLLVEFIEASAAAAAAAAEEKAAAAAAKAQAEMEARMAAEAANAAAERSDRMFQFSLRKSDPLEERLEDVRRDLASANMAEARRIQDEIAWLEQRISKQTLIPEESDGSKILAIGRSFARQLARSASDALTTNRDQYEDFLALQAQISGAMDHLTEVVYLVFFSLNSAQLTAEALPIVSYAIARANDRSGKPITIIGFTDTTGAPEYNLRLSKRRAEAVADAMVAGGIEAGRITATGVGEDHPLVPTGDGVDEPQNRRAVIVIAP